MTDGFVFYSSFMAALEDVPPEEFKECITILSRYAITGEEPEQMSALAKIFFKMAKPQIDANNKRRSDGLQGGRPRKPLVSEEKTTGFEKEKPFSKTETTGFEVLENEKPKEKDKGKEKEKDKAKEKEKDKAKGEEIKTFCSERSDDHSEPLADVEAIPLNDGSGWRPKQRDYEEFCRLYPGVDVKGEIAKMRAWSLSNPTKRKTKLGVLKFVNAWLSKTQDSGHRGRDKPSGYIDRIDHRLDVVDDWLREEGANDGSTVCDFG